MRWSLSVKPTPHTVFFIDLFCPLQSCWTQITLPCQFLFLGHSLLILGLEGDNALLHFSQAGLGLTKNTQRPFKRCLGLSKLGLKYRLHEWVNNKKCNTSGMQCSSCWSHMTIHLGDVVLLKGTNSFRSNSLWNKVVLVHGSDPLTNGGTRSGHLRWRSKASKEHSSILSWNIHIFVYFAQWITDTDTFEIAWGVKSSFSM